MSNVGLYIFAIWWIVPRYLSFPIVLISVLMWGEGVVFESIVIAAIV